MNDETAGKVPQEILDWARSQFDEEEFVAGLREIRKTGGLELKDFIHELEQDQRVVMVAAPVVPLPRSGL